MTRTKTDVRSAGQAHLEYDPLLDELVVDYRNDAGVERRDLAEIAPEIWVEFDGDRSGRCLRVFASSPSLGRPPAWTRLLEDLVGPSVAAAYREALRGAVPVSITVGYEPSLAVVWATLHEATRHELGLSLLPPGAEGPEAEGAIVQWFDAFGEGRTGLVIAGILPAPAEATSRATPRRGTDIPLPQAVATALSLEPRVGVSLSDGSSLEVELRVLQDRDPRLLAELVEPSPGATGELDYRARSAQGRIPLVPSVSGGEDSAPVRVVFRLVKRSAP